LVTLAQARELGATAKQVRHRRATGRWVDVAPGVVAIAGAPRTPRQQILAAVLAVGRGAVASHRSGAWLSGLPGFRPGLPEVTVGHHARVRSSVTALLHRSCALPSHHLRVVDAIPVTGVARTLFDLGAVVHEARLGRLLDHCLSAKAVTMPACWRVVHELSASGRDGSGVLRALLQQRGGGYVAPASELEARFAELLIGAGLPLPERERDLGDSDRWMGRVEFVFPDQRVLVECDSRKYHGSHSAIEDDRARTNAFVAAGYRVLRLTWHMITREPEQTIALLRQTLRLAA
jgi:alkylated DNA nucleotide flippase Atl1